MDQIDAEAEVAKAKPEQGTPASKLAARKAEIEAEERAKDADKAARAGKVAQDVFGPTAAAEVAEAAAAVTETGAQSRLTQMKAETQARKDTSETKSAAENQSETKFLDENYESKGVLSQQSITEFSNLVIRSVSWIDQKVRAPQVVIKDQSKNGKYFLADGWGRNTFSGVEFNPKTGESIERNLVEISVTDLVSGRIEWYLEKS
ncbi:MAG: hypothetical protein Athens101428_267 [Candidatus Berkelbacteria bacterium Athens1014_28]|uniref:Uncharacterized protein n=1 Tax=Candidatus Berkelbacteria bacterium Athens1014_28 TaxID=2017145 RepID=A0A554LNU1_9BACT|nr:MAG: hypothetical protein Athens101428_267 [Candidatus Berkelbacteria bacterium Athens1014_28]